MPAAASRSVLLLSFHFPPDSAAGALRAGRFFKYLKEFGYRPVVLTPARIPSAPDVYVLPAPMSEVPDKRTIEGWGELVLRKWVFPTEMAIFWSIRAARLARRLHAEHRFHAVLSTSPPFTTHLAAMSLKRHCGVPWIADFRDPLAGNPFRRFGRVSEAADRWMERQFITHADAVIGVTDRMVEDCQARWPDAAARMHVIWNGYDPEEPLHPLPLPARSVKVLLHIGTLYGPRHPMVVLLSLKRLLESGRVDARQVQVHLIGHLAYQIRDANSGVFQALTQAGALEMSDAVPRPAALTRMAEADYLLLLDMHDGADSPAVPAKIFEYIRIGRPILALTTRNSPVERILTGSGLRFSAIYPQDSEAQVDEKLLAFLAFSSEPAVPSEWFRETFDGRRQTEALARLLDRIGAAGNK